jgi:hypothetical protein
MRIPPAAHTYQSDVETVSHASVRSPSRISLFNISQVSVRHLRERVLSLPDFWT